uniref:Uncharacterized protein n=1 Tax=Anguilla anguilla TaxID=7936 RepID=A0A0E9PR82_ANGAN
MCGMIIISSSTAREPISERGELR